MKEENLAKRAEKKAKTVGDGTASGNKGLINIDGGEDKKRKVR